MNKLVELVKTEVGKPYVWGGQDESGMDCSGMIVLQLQKLGLISKSHDYTAAGLYDLCKTKLKKTDIRSGDLVFYRDNSGSIVHVGVYIGSGRVIEARGKDYGVVETELAKRSFNMFARLPFALDVREMTVYDAIDFLSTVKVGSDLIINSPKTWRDRMLNGSIPVEYVKALLIKFATKIKEV